MSAQTVCCLFFELCIRSSWICSPDTLTGKGNGGWALLTRIRNEDFINQVDDTILSHNVFLVHHLDFGFLDYLGFCYPLLVGFDLPKRQHFC